MGVEGNAEQFFCPVGLGNLQVDGEVVLGVLCQRRQAWKGGEFRADGIGKALGQCGIVELSGNVGMGKVAVECQEVDALFEARLNTQIVQVVVFLRKAEVL